MAAHMTRTLPELANFATGQFNCWLFSLLANLITGQNDHLHTYGRRIPWTLQTQDYTSIWALLDSMNTSPCENILSAIIWPHVEHRNMGKFESYTFQGTGNFQHWAHHALDIVNFGQNKCSPPCCWLTDTGCTHISQPSCTRSGYCSGSCSTSSSWGVVHDLSTASHSLVNTIIKTHIRSDAYALAHIHKHTSVCVTGKVKNGHFVKCPGNLKKCLTV